MKEYLNKKKSYILSHKILSTIILLVIISIGYWGYNKITSTAGETRYITAKVTRNTIINTVSGSGQVSTSNQINITPKVSGEVTYVAIINGQKVNAGALIAQLNTRDAQKSIRDAEINLESSKLSLEKLKIQNSNDNMNADLLKAYDDGFSTVSNAFLDLPNIVSGLEDILAQENLSDNRARMISKTAQDYRSSAETKYYTAKSSFDESRKFYRTLNRNSSKIDIEKIINQTYETTKLVSDAIKSLRNYVDFMAENISQSSQFTSTQNTLSTYQGTDNGHLDNLLSTKTDIKNYKDVFINSDFDIQSSELSLKQKQNSLQDLKDKLLDYSIRAPFAGTITAVNIKKSDSINTGTTVATLITEKQLAEISLNEVDVAKIKIGEKATLTFDAIPDLNISGIVTEIDSMGTVSQGVVTYNVKINFDTQDERIKSGMSVNAAIITDIKQDVIAIPNSAIKSQKGSNYVEMFTSQLAPPKDRLIGSISLIAPNKIPVEVGLSNDSQSEIISGIKEGDEIVIRIILPTTTTVAAPNLFGGSSGNRSGGGNVMGR
ncbi:MAG: efflux RND transporter periplasmic adaptor subunit [Candidatus Paceibacterota bacterium]